MLIRKRVTRLAYEGEGNEGGGALGEKTYTETEYKAELDTHLGGMRRKYEARERELADANKQLLTQAESAKKLAGNPEELVEAQNRIDELEAKVLTETELAARKMKKTENELTLKFETATQQADQYKSQYRRQVETTAFLSAANEFDAEDPSDFAHLLAGRTEWKEVETDDGTVEDPRVTLDETTEDGKPVKMEYTIREAIKRMAEQPDRYGYLFKSQKKGGLGGSGNKGAAKPIYTGEQLAADTALFRKLRKENPALLKQIRTGS